MMEHAAMEVAEQLLNLRTPAPTPPAGKESYRVQWWDVGARTMRVEGFATQFQAQRRFHELLLKGGATAAKLALVERGRSGWETRSRVVPKSKGARSAPLTKAQREAVFRRHTLEGTR